MDDKHNMFYETKDSRQVLTVEDFLPEDAGTYMLVAGNEYGKCARTFIVELAGR